MNHRTNIKAAWSEYREYSPPLALAEHLLCFWTQSITGCGVYAQRVLPDGCIDIIFINNEAPIVVGPWSKPFIAQLPVDTEIVGARWHPGRAPALFGVPAAELLNQSVALRDVWSRTRGSLLERVSAQQNLTARKWQFEASLLNLVPYVPPIDPVVNASIHWSARHPHGRVGQLSRWIGISSRQLQRRFSASVGYGPKAFQAILRFQRLLHFSGSRTHRRSLADLAAGVGYADQAHMTREVQRLSGCPPTVLLPTAKCALEMSDFFNTPPDRAG